MSCGLKCLCIYTDCLVCVCVCVSLHRLECDWRLSQTLREKESLVQKVNVYIYMYMYIVCTCF